MLENVFLYPLFYTYVNQQRDLFLEDFSQSIIDDYQEAIQQLLFRLVRLK
jgi:hypothetical protein